LAICSAMGGRVRAQEGAASISTPRTMKRIVVERLSFAIEDSSLVEFQECFKVILAIFMSW